MDKLSDEKLVELLQERVDSVNSVIDEMVNRDLLIYTNTTDNPSEYGQEEPSKFYIRSIRQIKRLL